MQEGEKRAVEAVENALRPLRLRVSRRRTTRGALVVAHADGATYELAPVWAGEGFPGDVHRRLARLRETDRPASALVVVVVVVARSMSPGGRRAAEEAGAGWVDEAGNARIVAPPGLAVLRDGAVSARPAKPPRWTPSAGAVAEVVLTRYATTRRDEVPPVAAVTAYLDWSVGQVAKALAFFDHEQWTAKEGGQRGPTAVRRLVDPGGLLSGWAAWYAKQPVDARDFSVHLDDPLEFAGVRLPDLLSPHPWCLTGWGALDLIAPFTTRVPSLEVYVDDDEFDAAVHDVSEADDVRSVETGARMRLVRAPRHVIALAAHTAVAPVASPIRVYGDLLRGGLRGEQAAEHLRELTVAF